jgi:hypothetical protein
MTGPTRHVVDDGTYLEGFQVEITRTCDGAAPQAIVDYWHRLLEATDATGPHWKDLDFLDIYDNAAMVIVKDVVDGGREYRNRFWGTGVTRAFNLDATNHLLGDYYQPQHVEQLLRLYDLVFKDRRTLRIVGEGTFFSQRNFMRFEAAHAPLYDAEGNPSHVLVAYDFKDVY